jgi:hypothetical protein
MNDAEMTQAVIESGDEFLNGETGYVPDPDDMGTVAAYAQMEARRFENMLRGYIMNAIERGDYVKGAA